MFKPILLFFSITGWFEGRIAVETVALLCRHGGDTRVRFGDALAR